MRDVLHTIQASDHARVHQVVQKWNELYESHNEVDQKIRNSLAYEKCLITAENKLPLNLGGSAFKLLYVQPDTRREKTEWSGFEQSLIVLTAFPRQWDVERESVGGGAGWRWGDWFVHYSINSITRFTCRGGGPNMSALTLWGEKVGE